MMKKMHLLSDDALEQLIQKRLLEETQNMNRSYEQELRFKQANIAALQAQINPHFLYNTLECIRGQAMIEGVPDIARTAEALSHFFRYSISGHRDFATFQDELESIRNYLMVQQYRFQNRFCLRLDLDENDPALMGLVMPKLSLQPIVENAILHGLSYTTSEGKITIRAIISQSFATIQISDNGCGMDSETLLALNKRINALSENMDDHTAPPSNTSHHSGIALSNINSRIKLLFGEEYGIKLFSIPGKGTDVELFLPLKMGENRK